MGALTNLLTYNPLLEAGWSKVKSHIDIFRKSHIRRGGDSDLVSALEIGSVYAATGQHGGTRDDHIQHTVVVGCNDSLDPSV